MELLYEEKFKNVDRELEDHEGRIYKLEITTTESDKKNAVLIERLTANLNSLTEMSKDMKDMLKKQSQTIDEIKVFMAMTTKEMSDQKCDIEKVQKQTTQLDNEGKFNIRTYILKNWVSILLAIGGALALGSKFFNW
jgi:chromosome segregation ATPase